MRIYNSLLSEYAVLGFEYGYALANPHALVLWEAQFGDFSNGRKTIIDQFVPAAEPWQRMNGIVMLLLMATKVRVPNTAAPVWSVFTTMCRTEYGGYQYHHGIHFFHALRRQLAWPFRKPLIDLHPKANLRHPGSYSHIEAGIHFRWVQRGI